MAAMLEVCQKAPKGLSQPVREKILWSDGTKIELFGVNVRQQCLEETKQHASAGQYHPYCDAQWWQHHAAGMFLRFVFQ